MITVREATGADVSAITEIFQACYGRAYSDWRFYDAAALTKLVISDDTLVLVAEDDATGKILGTGSVILEVGAFADLTAEFGRLAVLPEARHLGIATLLMEERLRRVEARLQIGIIEGRTAHPYTLKIAEAHGFNPVGFLPLKWQLETRESIALLARHFGNALELRKNHPHLVPEAYPLACLALENCGVKADVIVDEKAPPYPDGSMYSLEELTTEGYAALLRIERGRVRNREIFGPMRLHYGLFLVQARKSRYLIARENGAIAGAVGFILDPAEKVVRVFELISRHDEVVRYLLSELERLCRQEWQICYVEIDVSAYSPRMQRTLVELGFLPAAYVPALVFHEVERLDAIKMVRLLVPLEVDMAQLTPRARVVAETVLRLFKSRSVLPRIAQVAQRLPLFRGLETEQIRRLASVCTVSTFEPGAVIFREGDESDRLYVLFEGKAAVAIKGAGGPVGMVSGGECLGEISLLTTSPHSATATARTSVDAAVLERRNLAELIRLRPDIGVQIYKNLATGLGEKLKRADLSGHRARRRSPRAKHYRRRERQ
ncbi:MAG TPA: GNAT family N-acetyltransferase [Terriglobales bacterium]|jgi:GNAT superfamily N-acetyltransferase|nr:GNAT family N-acetyltransferase [Terriglobales bacterium]